MVAAATERICEGCGPRPVSMFRPRYPSRPTSPLHPLCDPCRAERVRQGARLAMEARLLRLAIKRQRRAVYRWRHCTTCQCNRAKLPERKACSICLWLDGEKPAHRRAIAALRSLGGIATIDAVATLVTVRRRKGSTAETVKASQERTARRWMDALVEIRRARTIPGEEHGDEMLYQLVGGG